jgi:3-oxoacyl-[acyl-carrier protein] reductase
MTDLNRKSALVTGGSGAIGRSVAQRLAAEGFNVVVHYSGKPAAAEQVVADIRQAGGSAVAVQADIADAADVARLFEQTLTVFGRVDAIVNCAGIMPLGNIGAGALQDFDRVIATNLRGTFLVMSEAVTRLTEGGPHRRLLEQCRLEVVPHLWAVHCLEGGRRGFGTRSGE